MDLTTIARVAQLVNPGGALPTTGTGENGEEAIFNRLILQVSEDARRFLDREVLIATRTQYFDVEQYQRVFQLNAWPILSVTSVNYDPDQTFDAADNLTAGDDYRNAVLDSVGHLELRRDLLSQGRVGKSLKVVYRGGMATDTSDFVMKYPDIASALDFEIIHRWRFEKTGGITSISSEFGTIVKPSAPLKGWTPFARVTLERHRRIAIAS